MLSSAASVGEFFCSCPAGGHEDYDQETAGKLAAGLLDACKELESTEQFTEHFQRASVAPAKKETSVARKALSESVN